MESIPSPTEDQPQLPHCLRRYLPLTELSPNKMHVPTAGGKELPGKLWADTVTSTLVALPAVDCCVTGVPAPGSCMPAPAALVQPETVTLAVEPAAPATEGPPETRPRLLGAASYRAAL